MSELLDHFTFIEPKGFQNLCDRTEELTDEWMQIFYIGRTMFSQKSEFPIKSQLAPLLERKKIFSEEKIQQKGSHSDHYESLVKLNMGGSFDIGRITSMDQVSHILPREFMIYPEDLFYAKLVQKELFRKEFLDHDALSIDDLVYGKEKELNRKQKVYILFDNSFSMNGDKFTKIFAAKAICLEYLRRVQKESPQISFRYFNQNMGPLIKINKRKQIKDLIKYIIHLNTVDCYETKVDEAILKAIEDIEKDPELQQAEILMITDGLGDVPSNIEKRLGKIKFHMVLIPGANISQFLKKYPNKEAWTKVNITIKSANEVAQLLKNYPTKEAVSKADIPQELKTSVKRILEFYPDKEKWGKANNRGEDIPPYWEIFLQLIQVYRMQEFADIFIKIPSLFIEKFHFSNMYELEQIQTFRQELASKLESQISNSERYEIFQKIKFFMKYLHMLILKEPTTKELQKRIKKELSGFQILLEKVMKDEWFVSTLDNSLDTSQGLSLKNNGKGMAFQLKKSKRPVIMTIFIALPEYIIKKFLSIINSVRQMSLAIYRDWKLKKRFRYIKRKISEISY